MDEINREDDHVAISARLWNGHQVPPADFVRQVGAHADIHLFVLNKEVIGPTTRAFDGIDRTTSLRGVNSALLQFVLRAVEQIAVETFSKENKDAAGYPLELFVETVVESDASHRAHSNERKESNIRDGVIRSVYGVDVSTMTLDQFEERRIDVPLLSDCPGRAVIEYRIWILCTGVNFAEKLEFVHELAAKERDRLLNGTTLKAHNKALTEFYRQTNGDQTNGQFNIAGILTRSEHWAELDTRNALLDALALYVGDVSLLNDETRKAALSTRLSAKANPCYLGAFFHAAQAFQAGSLDPRADPPQARLLNYIAPRQGGQPKEITFRFPCPKRVLIVPVHLHNRLVLVRYLPDYQVQAAQRRVMGQAMSAAQARIVRSKLARPRTSSVAIMQRVNPAAEPEDMAHLAGGAGDHVQQETEAALERSEAALASALTPEQENAAAGEMLRARSEVTQQFQRETTTADEREAMAAVVLESRHIDPSVARQRRVLEMALAGNVTQTSLHMIEAHFRRRLDELADEPRALERCIRHTLLQKAAFADYRATCTSPMADTSDAGRTINAFYERAKLRHEDFLRPVQLVDPKLSFFGHWMVAELTKQDQVYCTHSVHALQLAMTIALFDAYRVDHGLHFNVLIFGPPGTSKSRALEHVERCAIPGTVLVAARRTAKSLSSDENNNDSCEAWHEASRAFLCNPAENRTITGQRQTNADNGDSEAHEMMKSKLTCAIVRTIGLVRQPDGSFKSQKRISEQIMSYIWLTNMEKHEISGAMLSRFFAAEVSEFQRREATIGEKGLDESNETREQRAARKRCDGEFRLRQYLTFHMEKLISCGALTKPTLTTYDAFAPIFVRTLERHGIKVPIRSQTKLEIIVRFCVIQRAIFLLYQAPNAPFRGQSISLEHLLRADVWLYDDPEIVFWAFEFTRAQYIDEHARIVSRSLRTYFAHRASKPAVCERFRQQYTVRVRGAPQGPADPAYSRAAADRAAIEDATWATVKADDPLFDFNRFFVRARVDQLARELEAIVRRTETLKLTVAQIEVAINALAQEAVVHKPFVPNPAFGGTITDEDFPVTIDATARAESSMAATIDRERGIITFLASALLTTNVDPIEDAIRACIDQTAIARKYLRGQPHAPDLPHIYGARDVRPNPKNPLFIPDRATMSPSTLCMIDSDFDPANDTLASDAQVELIARRRFDESYRKMFALTGMSIDEHSCKKRLAVLNLPEAAYSLFSMRNMEDQILEKDENLVRKDRRIAYPDEVPIAESQAEFMETVRRQFAAMTPEEAVKTLDGRVSLLVSTHYEEEDRPEFVELLRSMGYDARVSQRTLARMNADDDASRAKLLAEQAKRRDAADEYRREVLAKSAAVADAEIASRRRTARPDVDYSAYEF